MKITIYFILAFVAVWLTGCDDMNELHQKYLDEGEDIYTGKPDSVRSYAGFNRLKLEWELNADPKITECCIYWNNRADSMIYAIDRTQGPVYSAILPLGEGKYNFELLTRDAAGNHSLTEQISGVSYGAQFQETIYNRKFGSVEATMTEATIHWRNLENSVGSTLTYTNKSGDVKELFIGNDIATTVIQDFSFGAKFQVSSLYIPEENAIDTIPVGTPSVNYFPTFVIFSKEEWNTFNAEGQYPKYDRSSWSIESFSTEEAEKDGPAVAANILDDKPGTFWHSQWFGEGSNPPLPHTIVVDMQSSRKVSSLELARRKDNKDLKTIEFEISEDNAAWKYIGTLSFPNNANPNSKVLYFPDGEKGRYLKLKVTESNNSANASISELYVMEKS